MSEKENAQHVIDAYRKRQQAAQRAPFIILIVALLLIVGAGFLIFWLLGPNKPAIALFSTPTPTPTMTATATETPTSTPVPPTATQTETPAATETLTPTAPGPFIYTVQDGESLWVIADRFKVDLLLLITINNLDPANPIIRPGDNITIPAADMELPSPTPLPENLLPGTRITYVVQLGDTVGSIALTFYSTVEDIIKENKLANQNSIYVGQPLIIRVYLVPTETLVPPTSTSGPTPTGPTPTSTRRPTLAPPATATRRP